MGEDVLLIEWFWRGIVLFLSACHDDLFEIASEIWFDFGFLFSNWLHFGD